MRRGWLDWVAEEMPREVIESRMREVGAACRRHGVFALVLYTGFTRPAQVSALSHFVPFWSQAVLVVTDSGRSLLAMATTGRTVQQIRKASVVDEVLVGPEAGAVAAKWLQENGASGQSVAVVGGDDLPHMVHAGLRGGLPDTKLVDAPWYGELAARFTATAPVAARIREIAEAALKGLEGERWADAHAIVASIDRRCRSAGAEEVAVYLAPDLDASGRLHRIEGPVRLGARIAVQLTLAYKGCWVRVAASYRQDAGTLVELQESAAARAALAAAARQDGDLAAALEGVRREAQCGVETGWLEGVRGGLPLATLHEVQPEMPALAWPAGSSLTLGLRRKDGTRLIVTHPKAALAAA